MCTTISQDDQPAAMVPLEELQVNDGDTIDGPLTEEQLQEVLKIPNQIAQTRVPATTKVAEIVLSPNERTSTKKKKKKGLSRLLSKTRASTTWIGPPFWNQTKAPVAGENNTSLPESALKSDEKQESTEEKKKRGLFKWISNRKLGARGSTYEELDRIPEHQFGFPLEESQDIIGHLPCQEFVQLEFQDTPGLLNDTEEGPGVWELTPRPPPKIVISKNFLLPKSHDEDKKEKADNEKRELSGQGFKRDDSCTKLPGETTSRYLDVTNISRWFSRWRTGPSRDDSEYPQMTEEVEEGSIGSSVYSQLPMSVVFVNCLEESRSSAANGSCDESSISVSTYSSLQGSDGSLCDEIDHANTWHVSSHCLPIDTTESLSAPTVVFSSSMPGLSLDQDIFDQDIFESPAVDQAPMGPSFDMPDPPQPANHLPFLSTMGVKENIGQSLKKIHSATALDHLNDPESGLLIPTLSQGSSEPVVQSSVLSKKGASSGPFDEASTQRWVEMSEMEIKVQQHDETRMGAIEGMEQDGYHERSIPITVNDQEGNITADQINTEAEDETPAPAPAPTQRRSPRVKQIDVFLEVEVAHDNIECKIVTPGDELNGEQEKSAPVGQKSDDSISDHTGSSGGSDFSAIVRRESHMLCPTAIEDVFENAVEDFVSFQVDMMRVVNGDDASLASFYSGSDNHQLTKEKSSPMHPPTSIQVAKRVERRSRPTQVIEY